MKRRELERALRAAARVSHQTEFLLLGSQAVHCYCRRPPAEVLLSQECDLYPMGRPEAADVLVAELGRGSRFARKFGYYVDVLAPEIANLPIQWESRLEQITFGQVTAHCLEIHDLIVAKLAASRIKDFEFAAALIRRRLAKPRVIRHRIQLLTDAQERRRLQRHLQAIIDDLGR